MKTRCAAIYLRVSTTDQNTDNQEHELRQVAERANWTVAKVYKDHDREPKGAISGRPLTSFGCWPVPATRDLKTGHLGKTRKSCPSEGEVPRSEPRDSYWEAR
jgi:hypothetical protein